MVAQKYPFKSFLIPSLNLSLFGTTFLRVWNIEGFDFKYDNSFQNYICNNTQIRHLKSQIWYFFENETFNLEKPEDADVSYENNFSKFQPKNTQIRHNDLSFYFFWFCMKRYILKILECWFKVWLYFFKTAA